MTQVFTLYWTSSACCLH